MSEKKLSLTEMLPKAEIGGKAPMHTEGLSPALHSVPSIEGTQPAAIMLGLGTTDRRGQHLYDVEQNRGERERERVSEQMSHRAARVV